jgi:hypothetical protein
LTLLSTDERLAVLCGRECSRERRAAVLFERVLSTSERLYTVLSTGERLDTALD